MPSGLKLHALRTVLDELPQKLNKATYIPKVSDNLITIGEARLALFVRYLENVRGYRRRDAQSEITCSPIHLVQQLGFIGKG